MDAPGRQLAALVRGAPRDAVALEELPEEEGGGVGAGTGAGTGTGAGAGSRRVTFGELADEAEVVATRLPRGRAVASLLGDSADAVVLHLACLLSGAVVVPVNAAFPEREVAEVLDLVRPAGVYCPRDAVPWVRPLLARLGEAWTAAAALREGADAQADGRGDAGAAEAARPRGKRGRVAESASASAVSGDDAGAAGATGEASKAQEAHLAPDPAEEPAHSFGADAVWVPCPAWPRARDAPPAPPKPREGAEAGAELKLEREETPWAILFTSGTSSGGKKGVVRTAGATLRGVELHRGPLGLVRGTEVFAPIWPLHGISSFFFVWTFLALGGRVVLASRVRRDALARRLAAAGVTFLTASPAHLLRLAGESGHISGGGEAPLPALRRVLLSGAPSTAGVKREIRARLGVPVHDAYGSTETGLITLLRDEDWYAAAGCGSGPAPGLGREDGQGHEHGHGHEHEHEHGQAALDADEAGSSVGVEPPGVPALRLDASAGRRRGEVLVRVDAPMFMGSLAYVTASPKLRGGGAGAGADADPEAASCYTKDEQGGLWYRTGDTGRRDARGRLHLLGRLDDRICLSTGQDFYPAEVEVGLSRPPALQVVAFAVGDAVHAVAVCEERVDPERALAPVAARALAPFKRPTHWAWVPALDRLPLTSTGKVKRADLPEWWRARLVARGGE